MEAELPLGRKKNGSLVQLKASKLREGAFIDARRPQENSAVI